MNPSSIQFNGMSSNGNAGGGNGHPQDFNVHRVNGLTTHYVGPTAVTNIFFGQPGNYTVSVSFNGQQLGANQRQKSPVTFPSEPTTPMNPTAGGQQSPTQSPFIGRFNDYSFNNGS